MLIKSSGSLLLYSMCKVELVLKGENENDMNRVNTEAVRNSIDSANEVLADRFHTIQN